MKWKALSFLPLAFVAGTHGFAIFAPYVAVVLAALHLRSRHRLRARAKARRAAAVVPAEAPLASLPEPVDAPGALALSV